MSFILSQPGKSRVRREQNQHGHHSRGLLKSHYTSLHHLQTQLGVKHIYLHKYFWDMNLSALAHPHVNELCLTLLKVAVCIKLLLSDLSLCMLQMTHLSLSLSVPSLSFCLFVSLPLCLSLALSLPVTSVMSWKQLHTNCASP